MLAWVGRELLKKIFSTYFEKAIKFIYIDLKLTSHPLSFCLEASEVVLELNGLTPILVATKCAKDFFPTLTILQETILQSQYQ